MPTDLLQLRGQVEIQAAAGGDQKPPCVSIFAYGGDVMTVPGFGPTMIDLTGLDASHPVQILAEHRDSIDGLLGTGAATKTKTDLRVDGTLTRANPLTERIVAMSKDGVSFSASVGVQPLEREFVHEGNKVSANGRTITAPRGGMVFVKRGTLRETSLVAIGADASATVSIAVSKSVKGKKMSDETTTTEVPNEMKAAWDREGLTDSERILARWNGATFTESNIRQQTERFLHAALGGKLSFADFDREVLKAQLRDTELKMIRAERPKAPAIHSSGHDTGAENGDVLQASLLLHLGHEELSVKALGEPATVQARRLRLNSLHDIMRAGLQQQGVEVPAGRDSMIRAAFSTNTIPGILSNVANKISTESYRAAPSVARTIARKLTANDFKDHTGYRLTADATFDEVGNAGEIKHGSLGESSFSFKVATHARMFGLTRQV